ncbi:MAG: hypothetical protein J6L83_05460 [Clostridia bacterium]|nr:hypothetical protein [Clostridia bacterium]
MKMGRGESTYTQYYSNFIGADMSSDPRMVARNRLAYSVNMWRDYESEQGAAVETFPGFRRVLKTRENDTDVGFNGVWYYKGSKDEYIIIHKGIFLDAYKIKDLMNSTTEETLGKPLLSTMNLFDSTSFTINNRLYIVNGTSGTASSQMVVVYEGNGEIDAKTVDEYYVPTTYYNGQPYEQRNALGNTVYQINTDGGYEDTENNEDTENRTCVNVPIYERVEYDVSDGVEISGEQILSVEVDGEIFDYTEGSYGTGGVYKIIKREVTLPVNGPKGYSEVTLQFLKSDIYNSYSKLNKQIKIKYKAYATHFNTIGNLTHFQNDKVTMAEAILGCTKSAVYDGRVFLTGNPELPNTVFYSQRNLTGANDPTYFGVYNYFNDGDGNTPNVDLLATPSMLMVIKGDTVQDGSVYYHVGADNPHSDKSVRDLVPRIYPSTTGAAGLGSAGDTSAYSLSCNFLDDPVFLSRRGLEGVSKEQLNAERTIQHRSSNIDRLLIKEDLAHASLAEWKGYLVICCNGHIYLADSRVMTQHQDGSYQYEWFYLEGVGTYEGYANVYKTVTEWPIINGVSLEEIIKENTDTTYYLWDVETEIADVPDEDGKYHIFSQTIGSVTVYYYIDFAEMSQWIVDVIPDKKVGIGEFYGAKRVLAVGELLIFATDFDICIFNTDKRGVSLKDDDGNVIREVDSDKIDSSWYSFNGVPYRSALALRLDDCDKKALTKTTIYGTTVARLKMMPGSKCRIKTSENGCDREEIAEAHSTRTDLSDLRFDNLSFAEDEDDITVMPELSRGWVSKQYYFESDGFCEPFGLYELSYIYRIAGKIRYL